MKILLVGATGAMGKTIIETFKKASDAEIVAGISNEDMELDFPLYKEFEYVKEEYEIIIDFSVPIVTKKMLNFCIGKEKKIVIATTGLDDETKNLIIEASKTNAVLQAGNMSFGVNVLNKLVENLSGTLSDFEVEIVESHHNQKVDAPSGTANMLFESVKKVREKAVKIFDRTAQRKKRDFDEVYIASLRGGNVAGEHTVIFFKNDEIIEIKHKALSKKIFADGALKVARYLQDTKNGIYKIEDVIK